MRGVRPMLCGLLLLAAGCRPGREPAAPAVPDAEIAVPAPPAIPAAAVSSPVPAAITPLPAVTGSNELAALSPLSAAEAPPTGKPPVADADAAALQPAETEPPAAPEDDLEVPSQTMPDALLPAVLARLPFDHDELPETASGLTLAVEFTRPAPGLAGERMAPANAPRLVPGRFGRGILLETDHANLFSGPQSDAETAPAGAFIALQDARLFLSTNDCWQGRQALKVATPGIRGQEGVALAARAPAAYYDGRRVLPAAYVASVYLKGAGQLMLSLSVPGDDQATDPVPVTLDPDRWQRYAAVHAGAGFAPLAVGPGRAADWSQDLPAGVPPLLQLTLRCETGDRHRFTFLADGFQLEQRGRQAPGAAGLSPLSWLPGGTAGAAETLVIAVGGPRLAEWRRNGSLSFWFQPLWGVSDGSREILLYLGPAAFLLQHADAQFSLAPAGAACAPFDWRENWHHLAVTWDADGRRVLYVDGYDYPNRQGEARPVPPDTAALALSRPGNGRAPNGVVDDLVLFDAVLTSEQVKSLAGYQPAPPAPAEEPDASPGRPPATGTPP